MYNYLLCDRLCFYKSPSDGKCQKLDMDQQLETRLVKKLGQKLDQRLVQKLLGQKLDQKLEKDLDLKSVKT